MDGVETLDLSTPFCQGVDLWTCLLHSVSATPTHLPTHVDYKGSHFNLVECKSLCPVQPIDMQPSRMRRLLLGYPPHALA